MNKQGTTDFLSWYRVACEIDPATHLKKCDKVWEMYQELKGTNFENKTY